MNRFEALACVRKLLAGGDVLSVSHVRRVIDTLQNCQLINGDGPTEGTTFTACYATANAADFEEFPFRRPADLEHASRRAR